MTCKCPAGWCYLRDDCRDLPPPYNNVRPVSPQPRAVRRMEPMIPAQLKPEAVYVLFAGETLCGLMTSWAEQLGIRHEVAKTAIERQFVIGFLSEDDKRAVLRHGNALMAELAVRNATSSLPDAWRVVAEGAKHVGRPQQLGSERQAPGGDGAPVAGGAAGAGSGGA